MTIEVSGREGELAIVEAFLDRPAEGPRALVVEGEAGIGKSTVWLAAVAAARERSFRVLSSRPAEAERTLANVVLGDLFGDVPPEVLGTLPVARRRAFESALLLQETPDVPVDPLALGAAILTLLPLLADGVPLVLAIDNDHWSDASSAATLGFALRRVQHEPILLVLSRRIDSAPATRLEETVGPAEVELLRIGPLSLGAMQLLLRQRLELTFPRPMLMRLHEVSGGNPFFALELARAQSADPGRDATMPLVVPSSLERLVDARLGALDDQARRALLLIAAHGRPPVALLRAVEVTPETLNQARTAKVIETADGVVRFTHPLLASATYQMADREERRAAHRRLATVIEDPVPRGRHLALGADEPDEGVANLLESAVSVARDRGMPMAAAELGEHALRLTPPGAVDDRHRRARAPARETSPLTWWPGLRPAVGEPKRSSFARTSSLRSLAWICWARP